MRPECITCPLQVDYGNKIAEHEELVQRLGSSSMDTMDQVAQIEDEAPEIQALIDGILAKDNPTARDAAELNYLNKKLNQLVRTGSAGHAHQSASLDAIETSEAAVEATGRYVEVISQRCSGPYSRKKYFIFGERILLCSNAPTPKHLQNKQS